MKTSSNQIKVKLKSVVFICILSTSIIWGCSSSSDDSEPNVEDPPKEDVIKDVLTLVSNPKIKDGMFVDNSGHVYTTSGGLQNGTQIGQYNIDTENYTTNFKTGFFGPIDIDQKSDGLLVVTNFDNNTVSTVDLNTSEVITIASGLDGPAGIAIDAEDNIYISNFGEQPTYSGHQIHKITPSGVLTVLSDSDLLFRFQAIVINGQGELIVSSKSKLYKVDTETGDLELWADVNLGFANMVFRHKDSSIYATSASGRIYKIDSAGQATVFAGSTPGLAVDGDLSIAKFNRPQGIELSPDENILYVTDSERLRRIIFP